MPTARSWTSVVAVGKQLYVFGGGNNSNVAVDTTECFDTETNTWSTKKNMPYTANAPASEVIDGKVYLIGGYIS
ncbi:kelch repeat-containing protein [Paenibacillus sp. MER TA 81-3]|uniref:kelch repeat-containing protein n=1 Tax=Paenibacillus sp. MER TA 81-3 TaxID=2939573 RepID=UPI0034D96041